MTRKQRFDVVKSIVRLEKVLFDISLPACGSIYFKDSLPAEASTVDIPSCPGCNDVSKFCIGPSTELLWWYSRRAELDANIGPCE